MTHPELVSRLVKNPDKILRDLTSKDVDLMHMVLGISGEAGELLDAIKKHVIYRKGYDLDNIIEELGDLEFYLEGFRQALFISREQVLTENITKLKKRYADGYSDKAAQDRADKI